MPGYLIKSVAELVGEADHCCLRGHPHRIGDAQWSALGGESTPCTRPDIVEVDGAEIGIPVLGARQPIVAKHGFHAAADGPTG